MQYFIIKDGVIDIYLSTCSPELALIELYFTQMSKFIAGKHNNRKININSREGTIIIVNAIRNIGFEGFIKLWKNWTNQLMRVIRTILNCLSCKQFHGH